MNLENRKKVNLIGLLIHLIITVGSALIFFIFKDLLAGLFNAPIIIELAIYLPILTLAFIPRAYCQKLIYREQKMFLLFLTNLVFFGVNAIYILIIIFQEGILDFHTLIFGYIIGSLFSSIVAIILTRKLLQFSLNGDISVRQVLNFNWKMTFGSLLYAVPRQLDTVLLKIFFSLDTIGIYSAAKTIFRVFDEAMNAVTALVYPSTVRFVKNNREQDLESIISKTFSFGFAIFFTTFVILICGGSSYLFHLPIIPLKYQSALHYFNLMLISLPFLPFTVIYLVNIAYGRMTEYFLMVCTGVIIFFIFTMYIGLNNLQTIIPLGLASFYISVGLIGFFYSKKILGIKYNSLFRVVNDFKNYLKDKK
jgi:O-antigen/teichoic acid export membrane protein